jgi:hypothetical protein
MREPAEHDTPEDMPSGQPETPGEGEETHPEPPSATTAAPVEALLGFREFAALAPRRRSAASTTAAQAALQRWMRTHGHDTNGFYAMTEWQTFYAEMLADTGTMTAR